MKKYLLIIYLTVSCFVFGQDTKTSKNLHVSDTNESYSYKADFNLSKTPAVREIITDQFGEPKSNDTDLIWTWNGSYEVSLRDGSVAINFGKSNDNNDLYLRIKNLGNRITKVIK